MQVSVEGLTVSLTPFKRDEMEIVAKGLSDLSVTMYTNQLFGQTLESEQQWYDKQNTNSDVIVWRISLSEDDLPIGVTSLHGINNPAHTAVSGIIIWDKSKWGRGIASRAHLARTLFAADFLNCYTIKSSVRTDNPASLRALQRVGYVITGLEPRTGFRAGRFLDTHHLCWMNPARVTMLYPEGLPEIYRKGVEKASQALKQARQVVQY